MQFNLISNWYIIYRKVNSQKKAMNIDNKLYS